MIYVGGIFAGISFRRYIYGNLTVWDCSGKDDRSTNPFVPDSWNLSGRREIRMAMALIVGMPTMTAVVMMTNASGLDGDYALGGVFVTTVCGIMTLPMVNAGYYKI